MHRCPVEPGQILESLSALVDSSLVRRCEVRGGQQRFDMLDTLREYGLERMAEACEAEAVRCRHRAWCLELVEGVPSESRDTRHVADLQHEQDNLRVALQWSIGSADAEAIKRLVVGLAPHWYALGDYAEGGSGWRGSWRMRRRSVPACTLERWAGMAIWRTARATWRLRSPAWSRASRRPRRSTIRYKSPTRSRLQGHVARDRGDFDACSSSVRLGTHDWSDAGPPPAGGLRS